MSLESRARRAPGALAGVGVGWGTRFLGEARDLPHEETEVRRGKACALPLPPTALQLVSLTLIPTYPLPAPRRFLPAPPRACGLRCASSPPHAARSGGSLPPWSAGLGKVGVG